MPTTTFPILHIFAVQPKFLHSPLMSFSLPVKKHCSTAFSEIWNIVFKHILQLCVVVDFPLSASVFLYLSVCVMQCTMPNTQFQWPQDQRHVCLRPLKHWDHGFKSHLRHGHMSTFFCVMLSSISSLVMGWYIWPRSPTKISKCIHNFRS
jgi:hypothetical protein